MYASASFSQFEERDDCLCPVHFLTRLRKQNGLRGDVRSDTEQNLFRKLLAMTQSPTAGNSSCLACRKYGWWQLFVCSESLK